MANIKIQVKNASKNGRGIITHDNVAGVLLDNTFYDGNQAKEHHPRANDDGLADVTTTPNNTGVSKRHFPVQPEQIIEVF